VCPFDTAALSSATYRYKEIKDCNFNVVLGGFGATTSEFIDAQLASSEVNGLKAIVAGGEVISNSTSEAM
jgi:hypothetical protein